MKRHLFYTFLTIFAVTAALTLAGVAKLANIDQEYLKPLFWTVLIEAGGAVILVFKKEDWLNDPPPKDILKYRPSERGLKLLCTLWYFQEKTFGKEKRKLWAMGLPPDRAQYSEFFRSLAELIDAGLVDIDRDSRMAALTTEGYRYCDENKYTWKRGVRYGF